MDWQDYTVWAIGIAAAAVAVRWVGRILCGAGRGCCASCGSSRCPLKTLKRKRP